MGRASPSGMFQSVLWLADHWVILPSPQHSLAVSGDRQEGWGPVARFCRLLRSVDMARALFRLVQNVDSPGLWLCLWCPKPRESISQKALLLCICSTRPHSPGLWQLRVGRGLP